MPVTESIQTSVSSTSGASSISGTESEVGNVEINIPNASFPANSNAAVISNSFAFNSVAVQMIVMVASGNCTITTNNANAPTNTVNLVAGIPLVWGRSAGYFAQPMNANTNAGFLTCNASVIFSARILTT